MEKLKVFLYHTFGGFFNSVAAAALIYVTGFIEPIGAEQQIPYIILGMIVGIIVFTIAGTLIVKFMKHALIVSVFVFVIMIAAFLLFSPQNRVVTHAMTSAQVFALFGVVSFCTVLVSSLLFDEVARKHPFISGGAIAVWSFAFSIIILLIYWSLSESRFALITLSGEIIIIALSLLLLGRRFHSPRNQVPNKAT